MTNANLSLMLVIKKTGSDTSISNASPVNSLELLTN